MKTARLGALFAGAFALASGAFLARFELHTDDTGVEVFLLLACSFVAGLICARRAWIWALVISLPIPGADIWNTLYGSGHAGLHTQRDLLLLMLFVSAVGMAGAYAGAGLRRTLAMLGRAG